MTLLVVQRLREAQWVCVPSFHCDSKVTNIFSPVICVGAIPWATLRSIDPSPEFGQDVDPSEALPEEADLVGAFWGFPVVFGPSQPGGNVPREMELVPEVTEEHQWGDLGLLPAQSQALFFHLALQEGSSIQALRSWGNWSTCLGQRG